MKFYVIPNVVSVVFIGALFFSGCTNYHIKKDPTYNKQIKNLTFEWKSNDDVSTNIFYTNSAYLDEYKKIVKTELIALRLLYKAKTKDVLSRVLSESHISMNQKKADVALTLSPYSFRSECMQVMFMGERCIGVLSIKAILHDKVSKKDVWSGIFPTRAFENEENKDDIAEKLSTGIVNQLKSSNLISEIELSKI